MKKINLFLLLLVAIYCSSALATSPKTYGFYGMDDWNKPEWNKPVMSNWDKGGDWNKPEWNKPVMSNWDKGGDWNEGVEWDKDHASCKPKYDVPEPGIIGLLAIGLLGMVVARRKLKNK